MVEVFTNMKNNVLHEVRDSFRAVFEGKDKYIEKIEEVFEVRITYRGDVLKIEGEQSNIEKVENLFKQVDTLYNKGFRLGGQEILAVIRIVRENPHVSLLDIFTKGSVEVRGRYRVLPRSLTQYLYIQAIREYDIVISIGPAGTGKTYMAVAAAVSSFLDKEVDRIVLCRPAVEAGEKLGFLPGDIVAKVDPYLRPLYDALYDLVGFEKVGRLIDRGAIEIAPLAFMRGRTLNRSFVILDEAQNTTSEQMKMFLTRIGFGSKAVITGDITQIDLPMGKVSGLKEVQEILSGIEGIKFVNFSQHDVVRHPLVQSIIEAYEKYQRKKEN